MASILAQAVESLPLDDQASLLAAVEELSYLRELPDVMAVVRQWARRLTGADGVTFVLREKEQVFYADEDAIAPLWKGRRFPMSACISGWAILHRQIVVIDDIYADQRVPADAYRPTFVKSLMMVPIRAQDPIGAIGAYWARTHRATEREQGLIQALANATAIAVTNAELYREAQEAVRLRDEFLSIAAHEFRTPLTSLALALDGALRTDLGAGPATIRTRLERAKKSMQRLANLTERMLDASRIRAGIIAPKLEPQPIDLVAVVNEVVEQLREAGSVGAGGICLDASGPVIGAWDPLRVEQIVASLLSNACKYGGAQPVEVSVTAHGERARIRVRDYGMGIARQDLERIFNPFERGVPISHFGGFGLGLYIARKLTEAHGGAIDVESEPGQGATFTVELPRVPAV